MDYTNHTVCYMYESWDAFDSRVKKNNKVCVFAIPQGGISYTAFAFKPHHIIVLGKESSGFPTPLIHNQPCISIATKKNIRSLNVAVAGGIILSQLSKIIEK